MRGITSSFIMGTPMKICRAIQNFVKIGEDNEYLRKFYCCRRHYITIKTLSSSDMVLRSHDSREGTNIGRTRHNIRFFLYFADRASQYNLIN